MPSNRSGNPDGYPANWSRVIVPQVLREEPVCQLQFSVCTIESVEVDHKVPLAEGGTHERSNLQGVCAECHAEKTKHEAKSGKREVVERVKVSPGFISEMDELASTAETDKSSASQEDLKWFRHYGPAHERDKAGNYMLPKWTIGYQVLAWIMMNLQLKGKPFVPTGEQARFILWAYAVNKKGEWIYRELIKIAPKGWGKDPMLAMIAANELVGPSRFGGWKTSSFGEKTPIGIECERSWFQIAAGSIDQAQITFEYLKEIWTPQARTKYQIKTPLGPNIWAMGRTRHIEKMSSTPTTKEGQFPTGIALSELEHFTERSGGFKLYRTMRRNAKKVPGARSWLIMNAYDPSIGSLAQVKLESYEAFVAGRAKNQRVMLDAIMATEHAPYQTMEQRMQVLRVVYGDSAPFSNLKEIAAEFDSIETPISETLAFYYNCVSSPASSWVDIRDYDGCPISKWDTHGENLPPYGSSIILSFDGSLNDDATVLAGIVFGGADDYAHFPFGVWTPPRRKVVDGVRERGILIDRKEVDARVRWVFSHYKVLAFWGDPSHKKDAEDQQFWKPLFDTWHRELASRVVSKRFWASPTNAINFDMTNFTNQRQFVDQLDKTASLITDRLYRHTEDEVMRSHVQNARLVKTKVSDGHSIGKATSQSPDKVDGAVTYTIGDIAYNKVANHMRPRNTSPRPKDQNADG